MLPAERSLNRFVLGLIGVYVGLMFWLISQGWYFMDDFPYLWTTTQSESLLHTMFTSYAGHLMPGDFLLTRLSQIPGPMNWEVNAFMITAGLAVSAVLVWRVLRSIFGVRPFAVLLLVSYLTSGSILVTSYWWASAIGYVPLIICLSTMILLLQRNLRCPSVISALMPSVALLGGLFLFDKAVIYVPFMIALVASTPLVLDAPTTAINRLKQAARPLVFLTITAGLYLVAHFSIAGGERNGPHLTTGILERFTFAPITNVLFPNLLGLRTLDTSHKLSGAALLATAVVLMLFIRTCVRYRSGLGHWALLAGLVLVNNLLVLAAGRTLLLSDRYCADIVFPALLLIGLSQIGSRFDQSKEFTDPPAESESLSRTRRGLLRLTSLTIVCTVAVAAIGTFNLLRIDPVPNAEVARAYVSAAKKSASQIGAPVTLLEERTPPEVLSALMKPWNTTRVVLEPSEGDFTFSTWTKDPYTVTLDGTILPAQFITTRSAQLVASCGTVLQGAAEITLSINTKPRRIDSGVGMIEYSSTESGTLTVSWADTSTQLPLETGTSSAVFSMPNGDVPTVTLSQTSGRTCINDLRIGRLSPR